MSRYPLVVTGNSYTNMLHILPLVSYVSGVWQFDLDTGKQLSLLHGWPWIQQSSKWQWLPTEAWFTGSVKGALGQVTVNSCWKEPKQNVQSQTQRSSTWVAMTSVPALSNAVWMPSRIYHNLWGDSHHKSFCVGRIYSQGKPIGL